MRRRLDTLLAEKRLFPSRERAQRAVMAGMVFVDGRQADKPGQLVPENAEIEVKGGQAYVSRGGDKLAVALAVFSLPVSGRICLDLGASTGGFTDCLLQGGAARVYAVDVGHGQLAWKLRQDARVIVMEGVNARYIQPRDLPEPPGLIVIDVSFISLGLILPAAYGILPPAGDIVALIKPQFEAGREQVGRHGVVRRPETHRSVLAKVLAQAETLGLGLRGLTHSPLRGPEGNIEFFAWWAGAEPALPAGADLVAEVVRRAHETLG